MGRQTNIKTKRKRRRRKRKKPKVEKSNVQTVNYELLTNLNKAKAIEGFMLLLSISMIILFSIFKPHNNVVGPKKKNKAKK